MKKALAFSVIILSGCLGVNAQDLASTKRIVGSSGSVLQWISTTPKDDNSANLESGKDERYPLGATPTENNAPTHSYIEHEKQKADLDNQQAIDVTLTESIIGNSEALAFANGHEKKRSILPGEIPNAYKGDNSIAIPNAYSRNKDNSIKMPNVRLIKPIPKDSTVTINKITPKFLPNTGK